MFLDRVNRLKDYAGLLPGLEGAVDFLAREDLIGLEPGRYEIDGERVFAMVQREAGRRAEAGRLEAHRRYIDVQALLGGRERLGWRALGDCARPVADYDAESDLIFFEDEPTAWVELRPGHGVVFLPRDAHLPLVAEGELHKVVVKIACE